MMEKIDIDKKIKEIYDLSVKLWFYIADDNMKRCGHPGVYGPTSDEKWNQNHGVLLGAIQALKEVSEKI